MRITVKVWRQSGPTAGGRLVEYRLDDVSEHMSFLEMLDVLNEKLTADNEEPIAFDSDCREGICGMCGVVINGQPHGPEVTTTCQLHMRSFKDGDTITVEPWRADPSRSSRTSSSTARPSTGSSRPAGISRSTPARHPRRTRLRWRGQGGPRLRHRDVHRLRRLRGRLSERRGDALHGREDRPPRRAAAGQPERWTRVVNMVGQHDLEGFGGCTNIGECAAACPREIPLDVISQLNSDLRKAMAKGL